ncbi:integral membrane sensor signal transduction histidine kinase [Cellulomonas flavigena DSM 20109]|uniref:histidine kinase n=1 Tax=Cellulomonas flavigena (strain ATCC 482 / DSM 20109 / BCRC 11376 / JCM 18109 / NBRC 3775 / NCIMB 8073 / NRS 134) TaxID=446466 RepID=D5UGZ3_CELFN|nr:histidine kinase [Cellulomonas flavigena]ADG73196.1 integral membrane sensor signal transduction histidine kinase [Cellulomonas flavigena DSM 20109]
MTPAQQRRRPTDVVPAVCWLLAVAVLAVPALAQGTGPTPARGAPGFGDAAWWWALGLLTLQAVVVARCGTRPRAAVLLVAGVLPGFVVLGEAIGVALVAVIVATYRAVLARPARPLVPTLVAAGALVTASVAAADVGIGNRGWAVALAGVLQAVAAVVLPLVLAGVVGARRDAVDALARSAAALERERDARVQVAVERERTAMARELHDIAAHHLSGIAVMTGAIGRQIDVDPEGAKKAVAQVREQSTAMLRDLRNLVVLLRDATPSEADGEVRMETLAGVADLVARARATGQDVTLSETGPVADVATSGAVGPLAQLAAYRVVQEALSNAARHAPGARCDVRLDAGTAGRVEVEVRNGPSGPGLEPAAHEPGYGLVGMRERAELTGATLRYGPTVDGGWQVRMVVPVGEVVAQPVADATREEQDR